MLFLGTSGWQYAHWRGRFYPPGVAQRRWLEHFADRFATVEINAAFYRLPQRSTFEEWAARTPPDMVFAVKASRYLTHVRRLRDPTDPVARLMAAAGGLDAKLGPVLLQLPPTLQVDAGALDAVLAAFPSGIRVAVEPRHQSWDSDEVRSVLEQRGAAICWADTAERAVTPLWKTAEWGYLRLHGGLGEPLPSYRDEALRIWADRLAAAFPPAADAYVYTNNDPDGAALRDIVRLAGMLRARGRQTSRTPAPAAVGLG
ncbi:MAG: DUF72 domain-containing protein [Frankiaceae bacterium]